MNKIKGRQSYRKYRDSSDELDQYIDSNSEYGSESEYNEESVNKSSKSELKWNTNRNNSRSRTLSFLASFLFFIMLIIGAGWAYMNQIKVNDSCSRAFADLPALYGLTEESAKYLDMLSVGVDDVVRRRLEETSLGVFLFVHRGDMQIKQLIEIIAERVSRCFFDTPTKSVEMPIEEFTAERALFDYGYIIERFLAKLKEGRVVKVANLNEIPAESAIALHFICDTYSPPASNVIIFLSLVTDGNKVGPTKGGREKLETLWQKLDKDELDPLINRLTNIVIPLELKKSII